MRRRELASYAAVVVGVALLAIAVACLIGMAGCGTGTGTPAPAVTTSETEDVHDCDLDDLLEGDKDCYGTRRARTTRSPQSTTRPRTGVPLRQPAPRRTR